MVVGRAFHWFTRPQADAEIARILRPGGSVALLWNRVDSTNALYEPFASLRRRLGLPRLEFDPGLERDRRWFGPTERRDYRHTATVTLENYLEQFASRSYVLALKRAERDQAIACARQAALARYATGRSHSPSGPVLRDMRA